MGFTGALRPLGPTPKRLLLCALPSKSPLGRRALAVTPIMAPLTLASRVTGLPHTTQHGALPLLVGVRAKEEKEGKEEEKISVMFSLPTG